MRVHALPEQEEGASTCKGEGSTSLGCARTLVGVGGRGGAVRVRLVPARDGA